MSTVIGKCGKLAMLGAIGALLLGSSTQANAQMLGEKLVIIDPAMQPDLRVSVNVPASIPAYDLSLMEIKINNDGPTKGNFALPLPRNGVRLLTDLTNLVPVLIYPPAGFTCSQPVSGSAEPIWSQVTCSGSMGWGEATSIYVYVRPVSNTYYCGRPTYADAAVSYTTGGTERTSTNNRAISRVDFHGCIN
jgi:hypothetical protein